MNDIRLIASDVDGTMLPRQIQWEDGEIFTIDRVSKICQAAALKAGGQGDRYTIHMKGRETYLFFERSAAVTGCRLGRWFVERRSA